MTCPQCQASNENTASFCRNCGTRLAQPTAGHGPGRPADQSTIRANPAQQAPGPGEPAFPGYPGQQAQPGYPGQQAQPGYQAPPGPAGYHAPAAAAGYSAPPGTAGYPQDAG